MVDLFTTKRQFLRIDEVAAIFEVSPRTVYNWIKARKLETIVFSKSSVRISVRHIRELLVAVDRPRRHESVKVSEIRTPVH